MRCAPLAFLIIVVGCSGGGGALPADGGDSSSPDYPPGPPDDEGGPPMEPDADGAAPDGASESDASGPAFKGRRVFFVEATLSPAGAAMLPASHEFTLILDGDTGRAIVGSADGVGAAPFTTTDGTTFEITGQLGFRFPGGCVLRLVYDTMTLALAPDGTLTGTGGGNASYTIGDMGMNVGASATFEGGPDTELPALGVVSNADPSDPFIHTDLYSSEPLPADTKLTLTSGSGDSFALESSSVGFGLTNFDMPRVLLRFGEPYVIAAAQIVDFAGNQAQTSFQFATRAAPPLAAEEGFEDVTAAELGGAMVLSGDTNPIITGIKSLYVAPANTSGLNGSKSQLTLRLAVAPGETMVRFSYRTVDTSSSGAPGLGATYGLGVVGKPVKWTLLSASNDPRTPFGMPDGTTVFLGPINTAQISLPGGVGAEVFLDRVVSGGVSCGFPVPLASGVIIDDLRVE